jgi:hypothetical protein
MGGVVDDGRAEGLHLLEGNHVDDERVVAVGHAALGEPEPAGIMSI